MKRVTKILFLVAIFLFTAQTVLAQAGRITGQVTDARDRQPLIGVQVVIQGTTMGTTTDLDGNFRLLNVRPGTYTVEFRYVGYSTQIVEDVLVRTDLNTEVNMQMQESVIEGDEVTVRATRDVVIRDLTSSESRVSREDLERLPVQELGDVVQLQAGVTVGPGGSIHIRGGRSTEVAYIVDGVRVTDDFDRGAGLRVENQAVEELQVVSGTFNAEYGQATSGIVNIVTRSGSNDFRGNVRVWGGDYATVNRNLFAGAPGAVADVDPFHQYNIEASFSGPIIRDKLTYFVTGRRFQNTGWLYGYNAFSPQGPLLPRFDTETQTQIWERGVTELPANNPVNRYGHVINESDPWINIIETVDIDGEQFIRYRDEGFRDSSRVAMNNFETISFQGNLQYNPMRGLRFNLIGNYGTETGQGYDHGNRLVAAGRPTFERENYYLNFRTTITPSSNTFMNTNFAMRYNTFSSSLYDSPYDRRYYNYERNSDLPDDFQFGRTGRFARLGTDNGFFDRSTTTFIGKAEISSQVTDQHFIKAGIDFQADILRYQNFGLVPLADGGNVTLPSDLPDDKLEGDRRLELGVPDPDTPGHEKWRRKPVTFSAYVQDRIEYENLIINAGVRFDYFMPNGRIPAGDRPNLFTPYSERGDDFWEEASAKWAISPRLGIAYPISANGVIHFSYGYFFQIPEYSRLYNGSKLLLESTSGIQGIFGNPDLKPEQSVKYEIGLKQEIFEGTALDVTIFYEDKRDYVSSGPVRNTSISSVRYGTWINRDYANIRGITAAVNQRISRRVIMGIDYTYSIAEDSNSDPAAEFFAAVSRGDTTGTNLARFLTPANWDRTHVLNSNFSYSGGTWAFNVIQRFSTGLPFTPSASIPRRIGITSTGDVITNSMRMPNFFSLDLNAHKDLTISGQNLRLFLNIYNLLDNRNVNFVYNDSGVPDAPLNLPQQFDEGFYNNPSHYSEPRRVQLGVQMSF